MGSPGAQPLQPGVICEVVLPSPVLKTIERALTRALAGVAAVSAVGCLLLPSPLFDLMGSLRLQIVGMLAALALWMGWLSLPFGPLRVLLMRDRLRFVGGGWLVRSEVPLAEIVSMRCRTVPGVSIVSIGLGRARYSPLTRTLLVSPAVGSLMVDGGREIHALELALADGRTVQVEMPDPQSLARAMASLGVCEQPGAGRQAD